MVSGKWEMGNGKYWKSVAVSGCKAKSCRPVQRAKLWPPHFALPRPLLARQGGVTGHGVWRPLVSGSRDPVGTLARGVGRPWEGQSEVQTYNWMMNDMPPQLCTRIRERATSNWTRFHSVAEFRQVFKATPLPPPCIDISL